MSTTQSSSGIGFCGLLTILFIGLKLTNYITWSWWWVLCPLWLGFAIVIAVAIIVLLVFLLVIAGTVFTKTNLEEPLSNFQRQLKNIQNNRIIRK